MKKSLDSQNLIKQLNIARETTNHKAKGYLYLSIEGSVYNLMMIDGPLAECGGSSTVKSFPYEKELIQWLKLF